MTDPAHVRTRHPVLIPLTNGVTPAQMNEAFPGDYPVYACDFYVDGAERGESVPGGLQLGRIVNVDHHAPLPRMEARVTSTMLAAEFLTSGGRVEVGHPVVINHTDCDSILSSALLLGNGPFEEPGVIQRFVHSSICADHSGEPDGISDLLQALDEERVGTRTRDQYWESLASVYRFMSGDPLEPLVLAAVARRLVRREEAKRMVETGRVRKIDVVAYGELDQEIDGAFFPALFPAAVLVVLATRHHSEPGRWTIKVRLGLGAPPGLTLHSLGITEFDPAFGGRWNAGSNKRGGGTSIAPSKYVLELSRRVRERLQDPDTHPQIQARRDRVAAPGLSRETHERLSAWGPGLYIHDGLLYEIERGPRGEWQGWRWGDTPVDPTWILTRGERAPLTGEAALAWLPGWWELDGRRWEITLDAGSDSLQAYCTELECKGSPYLVIANGRRLTREEVLRRQEAP